MKDDFKYDSTTDTLFHIKRVNELLILITQELLKRAVKHDESKLSNPEKDLFDIHTPKLKNMSYGSEEYKKSLKDLEPALKHHYKNNLHHPEHYKNGINDFTLIDLIELFCDWKASSERHKDGDIYRSIMINKERFGMSDQLSNILKNTANYFF